MERELLRLSLARCYSDQKPLADDSKRKFRIVNSLQQGDHCIGRRTHQHQVHSVPERDIRMSAQLMAQWIAFQCSCVFAHAEPAGSQLYRLSPSSCPQNINSYEPGQSSKLILTLIRKSVPHKACIIIRILTHSHLLYHCLSSHLAVSYISHHHFNTNFHT